MAFANITLKSAPRRGARTPRRRPPLLPLQTNPEAAFGILFWACPLAALGAGLLRRLLQKSLFRHSEHAHKWHGEGLEVGVRALLQQSAAGFAVAPSRSVRRDPSFERLPASLTQSSPSHLQRKTEYRPHHTRRSIPLYEQTWPCLVILCSPFLWMA